MQASELVLDADGHPDHWVQMIPATEWYTVQDASIILKMGTTQLYDCIKRGTIDAYEVHGVTHIRHDDLVAYIHRRNVRDTLPIPGDAHIVRIIPQKNARPTPATPPEPPVETITRSRARQPVRSHIPLEQPEPTDGLNLDALSAIEETVDEEE